MTDEELDFETPQTIPVDTAINENESLLDYTQRLRLAGVQALTVHGMPTDLKEIYAVNAMLDGIDRQVLTKARLDIEQQGADADQQALDLITAIVSSVGNVNPYESATPVERTIEHEGPVIEGVTLVENELDTRPDQLTYDSFMKDYRARNPKPQEDNN